jgi:hypothetical protein
LQQRSKLASQPSVVELVAVASAEELAVEMVEALAQHQQLRQLLNPEKKISLKVDVSE